MPLELRHEPPSVTVQRHWEDASVVVLSYSEDVPDEFEVACEEALKPFLLRKMDEQTLKEMSQVLYHFVLDKWLSVELVWSIFNEEWVYTPQE